MKTFHWVTGTGMAVALTLGSGGAISHENEHERTLYKGDSGARAVCMSIARDDVSGLKSALRSERRAAYERTNTYFRCNSLSLDEFAFQQGAEETSTYLAPLYSRPRGTVRIEQVGSIED